MKPESVQALRSLGGGMLHALRLYGKPYFNENHDWAIFCSHLHIPEDTVHGVEVTMTGFILYTRKMTFKYTHDDFSNDARIIELTYGKTK
jgi:hypothetical protein